MNKDELHKEIVEALEDFKRGMDEELDETFKSYWGTPPQFPTAPKICSKPGCKKENDHDAKRCWWCGGDL